MTATVKYQVATYSGTVRVVCDENEEDEYIIARAKKILRQRSGAPLPYGYEHWKVIDRS